MSDVRFWVQRYISEGWSPLPIIRGDGHNKAPHHEDWQQRTYTVADFADDDNVGIHLGKDVIDVDIDDPVAVIAADLLLPKTAAVFGRTGKSRSHRFYICNEEIHLTKYTGLGGNNDTIIELRGKNSVAGTLTQTVVPPSIHKSGETLEWESSSIKPLTLAIAAPLKDGVRNVAIATLIARSFPGPGNRHDPRLSLAGFLARSEIPEPEVMMIGLAVMRIVGGNEGDWRDVCRTTFAKIKAGNTSVTGGPKLAEMLQDGPQVLKKLNRWLGRLEQAELDEAMARMNAKHFWCRLGKDDVVGREDDPSGVVFQKPGALRTEYANQKLVVGKTRQGPKTISVFDAWLDHENRRSYRKVVFAPPPEPCDPQDYNLWQGYAVQPATGDCSRLLEHIFENICSENQEHFDYLMNLLALTVQEPGSPSGVATVLRGETATGKGIFVRAIGALFGSRHYVQLDKVDQFTGHFNAALSGKIIIFADEAFWAGDKREIGALRRLITEPTLHIVRKGFDGEDEKNHVHLFMATNNEWSFPAMPKERRAFLLNVSNRRQRDTTYFGAIQEQLQAGGLPALLGLLLDRSIDRAQILNPPNTAELKRQQLESMEHELKFVKEYLLTGILDPTEPNKPWPAWIEVTKLFKIYRDWARERGVRRPIDNIMTFGLRLGPFFSAEKSRPHKFNGKLARAWKFRSLNEARDYFDRSQGQTFDWEEAEDEPEIPY